MKTKTELKMYLFKFHNTINNRKLIKIETPEILNKYKRGNLKGIIITMQKYFKTNIPSLMTEQMRRRQILTNVTNLIIKNKHIFDN